MSRRRPAALSEAIANQTNGDGYNVKHSAWYRSTSNNFVSTSSGYEDLHLKEGADAINVGASLSGTFTDDIDGETRSGTWDMGADEYYAPTPFKYRRPLTFEYEYRGTSCGTSFTLSNYPVLVSLSNKTYLKTVENGGHVYSPAGYDIIFRLSGSKDQLPHEIEKYDGETGTLVAWVQNLTPDQNQVFESLPLRRDVLTFLDYLSKNRTVGTQSTGNLPLKAVQDICLKFVNPVQLEETINGHTYKVRSEDEVWQLLFIHQLAFHSGMVTGGPAKIWKVTAEGQMFPQLPPPVQSFLLFIIWWTDIDWTIAFPVSGLANGLPDGFKSVAFACLQELTLGENAPFEPFADRLIKQSGLTWPSIDQTNVQSTMRAVVKRTVVDIMEIFSILECEYVTENSHGYEHKKLANIRLTPIGKGLLSLMK